MRLIDLTESTKSTKSLRTEKDSPIKRSSKYGVGKDMGNFVYIHKQYDDVLPDISNFKESLKNNHPDFEYNIIKYSPDTVTFLYSPDFDTSNEPMIKEYVTVKNDGRTKKGSSKTIYHHKWLFVKDDYKGFDVGEAFERSRDWLSIPNINFRKIGSSRDYWLTFLKDNKDHLPKDFDFS